MSKFREVRIRKDERKKEKRLLVSVMSVCSSICMEELGLHWKEF
jgi:hypothetical protein